MPIMETPWPSAFYQIENIDLNIEIDLSPLPLDLQPPNFEWYEYR